ncbi:MAG: hypothetical protein ACT4QD_16065 [Acidobacteriota bacterium]
MTLWRFAVAVLMLSAVSVAGQASADWDDLYREAIRHVQRSEWKPAEDKLLAASKAGPPSGKDVIRRLMGRDDYFPEFYLGVVYLNTGRAEAAVTQFEVARQRGVDPKTSAFRQLPDLEARAAAIVAAEAAKRPAIPDPKAQFKNLLDQAQRALNDARYDEAQSAAKQARGLNVDNQAADTLLRNIERGRRSAQLQGQLAKSPGLPELRRLLTEYEDSGVPLDEVRKRIADGEALDTRDKTERAAMVEFFSGNYQRAISALAEAEKVMALSARGTFYRACSLASLATRGRSTNQTQLGEARRLYGIAAQNAQEFSADLRYISPRLLELLKGS